MNPNPGGVPFTPAQIFAASGSLPVPVLYDWAGRAITPTSQTPPGDFGPGLPLRPQIALPDHPPREYQYTPGFNLITTPRAEGGKEYSFAQLEAWADMCPDFRLAVEYRKKQIRGRTWEPVPVEDSKSPAAKRKHAKAIAAVTAWLRRPNRVDRLGLSTWLGQAIESTLITDALVWHKQRHFDGGLSYVQVNGSTIKIVIDPWGHNAGFQQIIYGLPRTQYRDNVAGQYGLGEMTYWIYNPRVNSSYGTSPIEEILPTILTAVKRSQSQLAWYTDGNIPDAFLSAPEGWSREEIQSYQKWIDEEFRDNDNATQRRKLRVLPGGATYTPAKPFAFTKDESDDIATKILAFMGVPKSILISQVNRATAETEQDSSDDVGLVPLIKWLEENMTNIVQEDLGFPELQIICTDGMARQVKADAEADVVLVNAKVITPDEARAKRGLDPLSVEGSDAPKIDPSLVTRAFFEAGVIKRNEARAMLGLPPALEGGDEYITIGAFGITAPEDMAAASGAPKPGALPSGAAPQGGTDVAAAVTRDALAVLHGGEPEGAAAGAAHAGASANAGAGAGSGDSPAAKSERATWRRFAAGRWAKGRHADAFEARALPAQEAALIRTKLASARTHADVFAAFEKAAPKLTEAKKEAAVEGIKAAALKLFKAQYGEIMAEAKEKLKGNEDE